MTHALVRFSDLLSAHEWASAGASGVNMALISRKTGSIHLMSEMSDRSADMPEDIDDDEAYVAVPDKGDLYLGDALAIRFADERFPESREEVRAFFFGRGAYAKFHRLVQQKGLHEEWSRYERLATEHALRDWCVENEIELSLPGAVRYLNTALDLASAEDLAPLAAVLEASGITATHIDCAATGRSTACFETKTSYREPEPSIAHILTAIESLASADRARWDLCDVREFNVSYECGPDPTSVHEGLPSALLARMGTMGAGLRITLHRTTPDRQLAGK